MNMTFIQSHLLTVILWAFTGGLLIWLVVTNYEAMRRFISEVGVELAKCSWPWNPQEKGFKRYKELIDSTVVVAISSLLLAGMVTSTDFILLKVVGFLTRFHI